MPGRQPFQTPHQAEDGPDGGPQGLPRGTVPDGGEIRDGLTQEVAWEVRLRKRKAWCAKRMMVTAVRVPGQGRGGEAAPVLGN